MFGLRRSMNKCRSNGGTGGFLVFILLLGAYLACFPILWNWIGDGRKAFYVLTKDLRMIGFGISAIDMPLAALYAYFLTNYTRFLLRWRIMPKRGRKGLTPETIEEMRKLKGKGMRPKEIAKSLKLGVSTVYRYLEMGRKEGFIEKLKRKLGLK